MEWLTQVPSHMRDEIMLRSQTINDFLEQCEARYAEDILPVRVVRALRLMLPYVVEFYEDDYAEPYLYWALCLAQTAVMADDAAELDAKEVHLNIAAIARDVLEVGPTETWDSATVTALQTIRDTHPLFVGGYDREEVANGWASSPQPPL